MRPAPILQNEEQRLVSVHNLGLLDTPPEERFDRITLLATKIFHVPISTLTLVDAKREWFKSCQGLPKHEGDRAISFCGHALVSDKMFVVPDTKKDERLADNPMVTGEPYVRFYAGVPMMSTDGQRVGVFCIKDTKPREFSKDDQEILKELAAWAESEINARNLGLTLVEQKKLQQTLKELNKSQAESTKALLNVMEDLEKTHVAIALEKTRDEAILKSIGDGVLATDEKGQVIILNQAGEEMLGLELKEIMGKDFRDTVSVVDEKGEIIPKENRALTKALQTGQKTTSSNHFYMRSDKTKFPISATVRPVLLNEKIIGMIEIFRDITHEREVDRMKTEFISLASHQLRTPLSAMKWLSEMLLDGDVGKLTNEQNDLVENLHQSNERMIDLVNSLLNVARIESGRLIIDPKPTDLVVLARAVVDELKPLAEKKKQSLLVSVHDRLPEIIIDPKLIRHVYMNLLTNAIKYTPDGGEITVFISRKNDILISQVSDTGYGIPAKEQNKLFSKFFRGENIVRREPDGTGLGLYLVKAIIESSNGFIWFKSEESKGTTFWFSLPISGIAP